MSESDIVKDFLVESYENLDRLDRDLVGLEKNPQDKDALAGVFRTIHTIKGTCGFLGFNKLEKVAHVGENLLTLLRDGKLTLNPEITTALLGMVDAVRQVLKVIESTGNDGEADYPELRETLTRLQTSGPSATESSAVPRPQEAGAAAKPAASADDSPSMAAKAEETLANDKTKKDSGAGETAGKVGKPEETPAAPAIQESRSRDAAPETIRVGVNLLDKLMKLVGELVLARNQILQFANSTENTGLQAVSQRLNLITTELQEGVMKTRMQPIGNIWSKFPRVVRDLASLRQAGAASRWRARRPNSTRPSSRRSKIRSPTSSAMPSITASRCPKTRVKPGKPPRAASFLRAFHEGGQVNIEISDDGAGIDLERVKQKALENGLITADQAARLSDRELLNLIFLPGLLHRRESHQCFRPRRGHGRSEDQHREDRRHGRYAKPLPVRARRSKSRFR